VAAAGAAALIAAALALSRKFAPPDQPKRVDEPNESAPLSVSIRRY
jgi:hypothetical protein